MWKLFSAQNSVHNRKNFAIERGLPCFLAIERSWLRRFVIEQGWLCCVGGM